MNIPHIDLTELHSTLLAVGLYVEIYSMKAENKEATMINEQIEGKLDSIFPPTFEYWNGEKYFTKPLFGDLVHVLREAIDTSSSGTSQHIDIRSVRVGTNKEVHKDHLTTKTGKPKLQARSSSRKLSVSFVSEEITASPARHGGHSSSLNTKPEPDASSHPVKTEEVSTVSIV
jgi:hypothetical protein